MSHHNNFDLIRLLAALQVLVAHLHDHLGAAPLAALLTAVAAYLSWSLIEQPALALKRRWRRQLAPG